MLATDDRTRLVHILDAIDKINIALNDYDLERFEKDWEKRLVVERLLEIIGEAANHLSSKLQEGYTDIPWSQMIGMRNVVSHQYFRIDTETIWITATKSIPPLRQEIEQMLNQHDKES